MLFLENMKSIVPFAQVALLSDSGKSCRARHQKTA